MFCHKCGHKLKDDARYCSYCGTPVDEKPKVEDNDNKVSESEKDITEPINKANIKEVEKVKEDISEPPKTQKNDNEVKETYIDEIGKGSIWIFKGIGKLFIYTILIFFSVGFISSMIGVLSGKDFYNYRVLSSIIYGSIFGFLGASMVCAFSQYAYKELHNIENKNIWKKKFIYPVFIIICILGGVSWGAAAVVIIFITMVIHIRHVKSK